MLVLIFGQICGYLGMPEPSSQHGTARFGHLRPNCKYLHYLQLNMFTKLKLRSRREMNQTNRPDRDNKHQSWLITNCLKQYFLILGFRVVCVLKRLNIQNDM